MLFRSRGRPFVVDDLWRPGVYALNRGSMHTTAALFVASVAGAGIWALHEKAAVVPTALHDIGMLFLGGLVLSIVCSLVGDVLGKTLVSADDAGIGVVRRSNVTRCVTRKPPGCAGFPASDGSRELHAHVAATAAVRRLGERAG